MPPRRPFEDIRLGDPPTHRETQVAIGILFGRCRKLIARDLGLGLKTIDTYRLRLYKKFGVHTAHDLVRVLMEKSMPVIHLHSTNLQDQTVEISVDGVRHEYKFMTNREIDTVQYLFRISGLKALNYAKNHCETHAKWEDE